MSNVTAGPPAAGQTPSHRGTFVTLVIPAYNEAGTIAAVVEEALTVLRAVSPRFEILVGNDGSTDGTREIVDALVRGHPEVRAFHTYPNRGVAQNCLDLYRRSEGDVVAFFPGDGQVRPGEIVRLLDARARFDIVVGHRKRRRDPWRRRTAAWLWSAACRVLFGLRIWDVDSVKLFPGEFVRALSIESRSPFMETEILVRARAKHLRIGNVDVEHFPRTAGANTGGRLTVVVGAVGELLRFWISWTVLGKKAGERGRRS